jgi:hypothetical protein
MILTVVSDWSVYSCPDPTLTPYRDSWLPLSMSDPASFYEVLSQIALHVVSLRKEVGCVRSLTYHSLAISSVNKRLSDPILRISDGIIHAILALASFCVSDPPRLPV